MQTLPYHYIPYTRGDEVDATEILALFPAGAEPDLETVVARLREDRDADDLSEIRNGREDDEGSFNFTHGHGERAIDVEIALHFDEEFAIQIPLSDMPEEVAARARESRWGISVNAYLGPRALSGYHSLLKLLDLAVPDAVLTHDTASLSSMSGPWLREVARSPVPPPPSTLISIHGVHDSGSTAGAWLHTHGLRRCGSIDLEMIDVPPDRAEAYAHMLEIAATYCIERGTPPVGKYFEVGKDLGVYWLPWEWASDQQLAGCVDDVADRDQAHDGPYGTLFAAPDGLGYSTGQTPTGIDTLQPQLDDEPVFFLSEMETRRMSLLAKTTFPRFRSIQQRFQTHEGWKFLVKLGYQIDDCPDDVDENEHLWFDVHEIHGAIMVATLLNEPYRIARLHQGDRGHHAADQLSDWTIECPHGLFNASNLRHLEELAD